MGNSFNWLLTNVMANTNISRLRQFAFTNEIRSFLCTSQNRCDLCVFGSPFASTKPNGTETSGPKDCGVNMNQKYLSKIYFSFPPTFWYCYNSFKDNNFLCFHLHLHLRIAVHQYYCFHCCGNFGWYWFGSVCQIWYCSRAIVWEMRVFFSQIPSTAEECSIAHLSLFIYDI